MARPRILLADDHHIVIKGLRRILEDEFEIAGVVAEGRALVQAAMELKPDVIVADITIPLLNGIEAARQILRTDPGARIVFLTMHPDVAYAIESLDAGALGYVLKSSAGNDLVTAVREALRGHVFVAPEITVRMLQSRSGHPPERSHTGSALLTDRQQEIARLIAEGRTIKEIAALLNISTRTVEFHKYRAIEALGLRTVVDLIQYAIKHLG